MDREEINRMLGVLSKSKVKTGSLHNKRNQLMNRLQRKEDYTYNTAVERERQKVLGNLALLNEFESIKSKNKKLLQPEFEEINIPKRKLIFFEGR